MSIEQYLQRLGQNLSISRRTLLVETIGFVGVLGCKPKDTDIIEGEPTFQKEDDQVRIQFYLPSGIANPETGTFRYTLKPGSLINRTQRIDEVGKYPLRVRVALNLSVAPSISLQIALGRIDEAKTRLFLLGRVNVPDFKQNHVLTMEWNNWNYKQAKWDGKEIPLQNQII